jgi:hypothetical protein
MPITDRTTTFIAVPPPPLPEFYSYQQERKGAVSPSSSSSSADEADREILVIKGRTTALDGAYDGRPSNPSLANPLQRMVPNDVPPLAIYHICRICLRPRSPRYHREHPIPINGVPPPPGICRRCRVTAVQESTHVDEYVVKARSNEVKLGFITPFIDEDAIVSNEEMRRMKAEEQLRRPTRPDREVTIERSKSRSKGRSRKPSRGRSLTDVKYRHLVVEEEDDQKSSSSSEVEVYRRVGFTSQEAIDHYLDKVSPEPLPRPRNGITSMLVEPTEQPATAVQSSVKTASAKSTNKTKTSVATRVSSHTSRSGSHTTAKASARVTTEYKPERTDSEIRQIAREEVDRYAKTFQPEQRTESEIRKISREEIERYRTAERKLERHPDPYAHGKLVPVVPVERRIEIEKDIPGPVPWAQPEQAVVENATIDVSVRESIKRASSPWRKSDRVSVVLSER